MPDALSRHRDAGPFDRAAGFDRLLQRRPEVGAQPVPGQRQHVLGRRPGRWFQVAPDTAGELHDLAVRGHDHERGREPVEDAGGHPAHRFRRPSARAGSSQSRLPPRRRLPVRLPGQPQGRAGHVAPLEDAVVPVERRE